MKTLSTTLIILPLLAVTGFFFQSCNGNHYSVDETILADRTEPGYLSNPDTESIEKFLPLSNDIWQGYHFRMLTLNDVAFSHVYEAQLEPACQYLSNIYNRQDEEKNFFATIDSGFQVAMSVPAGRPHSSIYIPLANELQRLSESSAKRKILIAYSDMIENTSIMRFYNPETLELLKTNPDSVKKIFESEVALPNLSGIEVYIIYQPKNETYSEWFRASSGFYKAWLESKGAKVVVEANLTQ